jgi:flagellar hook-basal body complex protein FliE
VIDEYRLLVFPKDNDRGEALLEEFYHLLNQMTPPTNPCGGGSAQESGSVRPVPQSEQSKDAQRAPSNQPEPQFPSNPAPSDSDDDADDSSGGAGESDSDGDDESGGSNGQPTDNSSDSTPSTNKSPSPSNPAPQSNDDKSDSDQTSDGQGAGTGESIVDTLRNALDKVVNEAREDIINDANAINGMENPLNGVDQNIRKATYDMETVTPETAQASNGFARVLEELQAKHDSGWNRQVSSGKVNLGRWLADKDFDTAFDRFEVGREDAVDIECVVLLDVSGSMSPVRREAFEAMWAIKRALDTVNASTTVITFASDSEVLYGSGDSATSQMRHSHHSGGTEPLVGLAKAQGILADSTRAIKVMLTITDGQWESEDKCDKIAEDLRLGGVLTGLVNLNTGYRIDNDHGFEFVADISEVRGIIALGRELVATATARNLAN